MTHIVPAVIQQQLLCFKDSCNLLDSKGLEKNNTFKCKKVVFFARLKYRCITHCSSFQYFLSDMIDILFIESEIILF